MMSPELNIDIGEMLTVIPISHGNRNRWFAKSLTLPSGWTCDLVHRASTELLPNQAITGWILGVDFDRRHVEVSDSNFGFLPISDRMRPRYVASLRHIVAILKEERNTHELDIRDISEVKGMFSRCARRDQWDWRAVHLALGEPTIGTARKLATIFGMVSSALRAGNIEAAQSILGQLRSGDFIRLLVEAAETIQDSAPQIAKARSITSPGHRKRRNSAEASQRSILSTYSKEKLDSANATHAELIDVLATFLGSYGHRVETNQFIDAFTRLKSGPAIFEVKSVTDENELSQVRQGLSQLYEYRFRHYLKEASLWLLLSRAPNEQWLIDYLEKDRGVHFLWMEEGKITGPSADKLLESGSDTLRRKGD